MLALVLGVLGPWLVTLAVDDHNDDTVAYHADGSSCPDPCSDGHDCGDGCLCTCCHGRLFATRDATDFLVFGPISVNLLFMAHLFDPEAEGVKGRVFHPPRG
ncbi:MAG TPA: hypothetical protein PLV85_16700 [Polyangiaceae bacterium]|nr:hypothetical protein [Polyangiaceae bacterium]HQB45253.1 hypothetical protein [Polyangiaceae bacterium]